MECIRGEQESLWFICSRNKPPRSCVPRAEQISRSTNEQSDKSCLLSCSSIVGYLFLKQDFQVSVNPRCVPIIPPPHEGASEGMSASGSVCYQGDGGCNGTGDERLMCFEISRNV